MLDTQSAQASSREPETIAYGERAARVYDWILARILSTEMAPGTFIDKTAVAAAIGVSKQPVTVALARLAREGWVEIESRVGSYVARVDSVALRDIAYVWFAALALMAYDVATHSDADLVDQVRPLRRDAEAALAAGDMSLANAHLRAADLLLIERVGNLKARRYFGLYRAHFGRYMRHVEMSPSLRPLTRQARRDAMEASIVLFDAIERGDVAAVSATCDALEQVHIVYLERISSIAG